MTHTGDDHIDARELEAFLDGGLPLQRADAVRAHCDSCASCQNVLDELRAVRELLQSDAISGPLRPMWAAISDRLRASRAPRFRLSFALGTSTVALVGVVLGLILGSFGGRTSDVQADSFATGVVVTLTGEESSTIAGMYLSNLEEGGQ